ncbi:MAG: GAF domain-containing protein [Candidatus Promineifilaceae bacterium]|nr:GAF domain-containing protein [Candidatus Promineifilaceae bacterium]
MAKAEALLRAAQDEAWNGNHAQAIALCSEALETIELEPSIRLDLLDTRAESFNAQGQYALAAQDASAMIEIAGSQQKPEYQAQALNRLALVQLVQGQSQAALQTAEAALQHARAGKFPELEAASLIRYGRSQRGLGNYDAAVEAYEKSAVLYRRLNNTSGESRAFTRLSDAYYEQNETDKAFDAGLQALTLGRRAGDTLGVADALTNLSYVEADISKALKLLKQALQAYDRAGYLPPKVGCYIRIAYLYRTRLRLVQRGRRLLLEGEDLARRIGAEGWLGWILVGHVVTEIFLGRAERAHDYLAELMEFTQARENADLTNHIPSLQIRLALLEKDLPNAITLADNAARAAQEAGDSTNEIASLGRLGQAYLLFGENEAALRATSHAVQLHHDHGLGPLVDSSREEVWWWHSQALLANNKDGESYEALNTAYQFLLEGIGGTSDVGLRRSYLNKIAVHRQIVAAWLETGQERNLAPAELYAYLAGEADLREPFRRLVDTGLLLNELQMEAELQSFLIEEATELSGAERVLLVLESDGLRQLAGSQMPPGETPDLLLQTVEEYFVQVRQSRQVLLETAESPDSPTPSRITAPLLAQSKVLGYLYADMDARYGSFDQTDADMLGMLASQAAVALENLRLVEGLEEQVAERTAELQAANADLGARNAELQIINSIQAGLVEQMDMQGIYDLVGDKIRETFPAAQSVWISGIDPQLKVQTHLYNFEKGQRHYFEPDHYAGKKYEAWLDWRAQSREVEIINENVDAYVEKNGFIVYEGTEKSKSMLFIPLLIGDTVRGFISLQDIDREHAFSDGDVRLLTTISNAMSVALENARLFAETQRLLHETERRAGEMAALEEVGREVSATLELEIVLERIAGFARELLHADTSALYLPESDRPGVFRAITVVGAETEEIKAAEISYGQGILGDIARSRAAELVNNTQQDPRTLQIPGTASQAYEHMLAAPLLSGDELRGLTAVWRSGEEHEFVQEELNFLTGLAQQAVVAIENARLYSEAQEAKDLAEQAQQTAEQANEVKSAFLASMSHELRTPLNAIIGFTRIVKRKAHNSLPERQLDNLGKVQSSAEHLLGLINTVLDIAKIEAGRMDVLPSEYEVEALVEMCLATAEPLTKAGVSMVSAVPPELPRAYSDQEKIRQILLNLLSNAAKFTHEGEIVASCELRDASAEMQAASDSPPTAGHSHTQMLVFRVQDSGIGMNEEQLARVFEEFQQAESTTARDYGGTGLGLPISKKLAQLLGGDLTAGSVPGEGSTFSLTIPLRYSEEYFV